MLKSANIWLSLSVWITMIWFLCIDCNDINLRHESQNIHENGKNSKLYLHSLIETNEIEPTKTTLNMSKINLYSTDFMY